MTYNRKGFTIIEISIVILIIGVLAAMAFGGFRWLREIKRTQTETKLAQLDTIIEGYRNKVKEYPSDLQELIDGPSQPQLQRRWSGTETSPSELDDVWGQPFVYTLNPRGSRPPYDLYSVGPKGDETIYSPVSQEAS